MTEDREIFRLKAAIAEMAARLMAQDKLADLAGAKRKAAAMLNLADSPLPSDSEVLLALEHYRQLFNASHEGQASKKLEEICQTLSWLAQFDPWLLGSSSPDSPQPEAPITIQVFTDDPKSVEFFLINEGINYKVATPQKKRPLQPLDVLYFEWRQNVIHLELWAEQDLRQLPKFVAGQKARVRLKDLLSAGQPFISK